MFDWYVEYGTFTRGMQADSPLLTGLAIDVYALFDADGRCLATASCSASTARPSASSRLSQRSSVREERET